jgi:hypothetical protein
LSDRLPVRDELYLLAHDDEGKPLINLAMLGVGLSAALLIDLTLRGEIDAASGYVLARPRPNPEANRPAGGGIAWHALNELAAGRARPPAIDEVMLVWQSAMYERVRGELVAAQVLHSVKVRRLGLMSTTRYMPIEEAPVVRARTTLRRTIAGMIPPTTGTGALCGLIAELQLERALHLSSDLSGSRQAIAAITAGNHQSIQRILAVMADVIRYRSTTTIG